MPSKPRYFRARHVPKPVKRNRAFYNSGTWKRLRLMRLAAYPLCAECGRAATDVHHVVDIVDDPSLAYEPSNLESLCHCCHSKKTRANQLDNQ